MINTNKNKTIFKNINSKFIELNKDKESVYFDQNIAIVDNITKNFQINCGYGTFLNKIADFSKK